MFMPGVRPPASVEDRHAGRTLLHIDQQCDLAWLGIFLPGKDPRRSHNRSRCHTQEETGEASVERLPFNSFDFWGYLASGFLLLCGVDSAAALGLLNRRDWTAVEGLLAICVAYVAGHVIAGLSSLLLERGLVGKVLGWPSTLLFEPHLSGKGKRLRRLAAFYFSPLPPQTQRAAPAKASACGIDGPGEALFWLAFAQARALDRTMARLDAFLNQYSFCRNVAMALLIDSCALWWAYSLPDGKPQQLLLARVAAVVSLALIARYLKFLRHYALELFTSFAHTETVDTSDRPPVAERRTLGMRSV